MKKTVLLSLLLTVLLSGCKGDRHYYVKIINNSGKPKNLKPDDYLGYIDLFASEAEAMEWTIRFPDDTINNMKEKE